MKAAFHLPLRGNAPGAGFGLVMALGFLFPCSNAAQEPPFPDDLAAQVARLESEWRWGEAEALLRQAENPDAAETRQLLAGFLVRRAAAMDTSSDLSRHLAQGILEEARGLYVELLREHPHETRFALDLAGVMEQSGRAGEAVELLRNTAAATEGDASRRVQEALLDLWSRLGDLEAAHIYFQPILEEHTEGSLERLRWQLLLARATKDEPQCRELATEWIRAGGDPWFATNLIWEVHGPDQLETLLGVYSQLMVVAPEPDPVLQLFRGATRYYAKDYVGAESDLRPCLDHEATDTRARYYLARSLLMQSRGEEARPLFDEVAQRGEVFAYDAVLGLLDTAAVLGRSEQFETSLAIYDRVLTFYPGIEWAHLGRPLCFKGMEDLEQAEQAYRDGLRALPDHPQLLNDLALLLTGMKREDEARALFHEAAAVGSVDATENLAMLFHYQDRDVERSSEYFGRVLRMEPERPKARFYRELTLMERRRAAQTDPKPESDR